jgi:hypothetical protein
VADGGNRDGQRFCRMSARNAFSFIHRGLFESGLSLSRLVED